MALRLCVCSATPNGQYCMSMFDKHLSTFFKTITLGATVADFKDIRDSSDKIILFVEGAAGHDVMKDLCDDYTLPVEKRRVLWIYSLTDGVDVYRPTELITELKDIPFTNARGCFSSILAEHVMFSMLYFYRQTWRLQASRAKHVWDAFNMAELRGKTMGIIGYGDIGQATAKLATAFDMEVTGVKRFAPAQAVDKYGVRLVNGDEERDRVIRESDFVVNILPGTEETKNFFNKERFAMMKPTAVYISIGRGVTQNEDDLAHALQTGVIRAAAVDVFSTEPLPKESPLWEIGDDKLLFTAHSADRSEDLVPCSVRRFIGLVKTYMETRKLDTYRVDVVRGY